MPILDLGPYEPRNGHIPEITAHYIIGRVAKSHFWQWIMHFGRKVADRPLDAIGRKQALK